MTPGRELERIYTAADLRAATATLRTERDTLSDDFLRACGQRNAAIDERDAAREDTRLAAGELLVDMDEAPPGSLVARLLTACRLMQVERDAALAEVGRLEAPANCVQCGAGVTMLHPRQCLECSQ